MPYPLREELKRRLLNGDFSCEKELTMSLLSGKWKIVIIWHLAHEGPMRFGALLKLFKNRCSHRIMTKQLREMEFDGLIDRAVGEGSALTVEYSLTELGVSIVPIVDMMWSWGIEHMSYYAEKVREEHATDIEYI
jgi:DNA-binding HxlR family transcriptional regulator